LYVKRQEGKKKKAAETSYYGGVGGVAALEALYVKRQSGGQGKPR